tara:strand:+ start:2410 stop:2625 length:216 start_codon:yes stop_codon:yes gene_type:complete
MTFPSIGQAVLALSHHERYSGDVATVWLRHRGSNFVYRRACCEFVAALLLDGDDRELLERWLVLLEHCDPA